MSSVREVVEMFMGGVAFPIEQKKPALVWSLTRVQKPTVSKVSHAGVTLTDR
jgi:hypothetical protein